MDHMIDGYLFGSPRRCGFAASRLPPREAWPELSLEAAGLHYPKRLNIADILLRPLDHAGQRERPAFISPAETWSHGRLMDAVDALCHVLTCELGVRPGDRVLLRGPNTPRLVVCWLAVAKVGAIVVATMPLLRGEELSHMLRKTEPVVALCDRRYGEGVEVAVRVSRHPTRIVYFDGDGEATRAGRGGGLEALMACYEGMPFRAADTAADDVALISFTSGTSGTPKAAAHFHRDLLAVSDLSPRSILKTHPDDVFAGSPSLAFAYGVGGLMLFPLRVGATAVLVERGTPEALLDAIVDKGATILFAVPTAYRGLLALIEETGVGRSSFAKLRLCVSAGEPLPPSTAEAWRAATGHAILDSLGTTEMLNAVIHGTPDDARPGVIGRAVPGYELRVVDADMRPLPPGQPGRLAVKGPTGCRYLDDPRQSTYVRDGWNLTGDAGWLDAQGRFTYGGRTDDLIVSGGYKLSGIEVEDILLRHPAVRECAVVAAPDPLRGTVPCAFIILRPGFRGNGALEREMREFVRARIAPYKYPRRITFVETLPRTETGKLKRYRLRDEAWRHGVDDGAPEVMAEASASSAADSDAESSDHQAPVGE